MSEDAVIYESRDRIATITINRPGKLNALNGAVGAGLLAAWQRLEAGDDRVAVLTGAGDRAFTAGADLDDPSVQLWTYVPGVGIEVTKPIIAAVNGLCVGGGVVLLQFCDLAVMAEDAWLSYPEAKVGFTGGLITSLAARIPHKLMMEMVLVGERMTAARAYEAGLVNRVVPRAELLGAAHEYAERIAENAPLVLGTIKQFVARTLPKGPSELAAYGRGMTERTYASADLAEGKAAFREKRKPRFEGR